MSKLQAIAATEQTEGSIQQELQTLMDHRRETRQSRRRFLRTVTVGGAASSALAISGCNADTFGTNSNSAVNISAPAINDVLNFALNLEYLEASFYTYITTGGGLPAGSIGTTPGSVTGAGAVTFVSPVVTRVATQLALDEQEHVTQLRAAITSLGFSPVNLPALNLAAMGAVTNDASFVMIARQFETVGTSAYAGAAQYLVNNLSSVPVVNYVAQILDTEAQHESFLRQLCLTLGITSPPVDAMDTLPTLTSIFNTSTGLNVTRTTSQVLQILYAASGRTGVSSGGFFPNGLNGNIKTT